MTFLAPYWFFAASAILVPIAIHLWNKRQGKTVKVGSLRWLSPAAKQRWHSIKLHQVWLLALRCLVFILLAAALAQPIWSRQQDKQVGHKSVYVGQELLPDLKKESTIQPTITALLQRGYDLYCYAPGFEPISAEEWNNGSYNAASKDTLNYWSLLPALVAQHPNPDDSVLLFTADQQRNYTGTRPETLPRHIRWMPVATKASSIWLQAAVLTKPDSLLLVVGQSTREGSQYSRHTVSTSATSVALLNNLQLRITADSVAAITNGQHSQVQLQRQPLRIAIFADAAHEQEQRYLKAALQAISNYTGVPSRISTDTVAADWVFWLRAGRLPESIKKKVRHGLQVWRQKEDKPVTARTASAIAGNAATEVRQVNEAQQPLSEKNYRVGANGAPLLTKQTLGRGQIYTFRSGLSWGALGQGSALPELLLPLLLPQPDILYQDVRALDEEQLTPTVRTTTSATGITRASRPLLKWLVLMAFILFLMERIVAHKRSQP